MQICLAFKRSNKTEGCWRRFLYYLLGFTLIHVELVIPEACTRSRCANCASLALELDPERRKLQHPITGHHMISYTAIDAKISAKHPVAVCMTRKIDRPYDEHYTFLVMTVLTSQATDMKAFLDAQRDKKYEIQKRTKMRWVINGMYSRCSVTCLLCCRKRPDSKYSYDEVYAHSKSMDDENYSKKFWYCSELVAAALNAGQVCANGDTLDTLYSSVIATNPFKITEGHVSGMRVHSEPLASIVVVRASPHPFMFNNNASAPHSASLASRAQQVQIVSSTTDTSYAKKSSNTKQSKTSDASLNIEKKVPLLTLIPRTNKSSPSFFKPSSLFPSFRHAHAHTHM